MKCLFSPHTWQCVEGRTMACHEPSWIWKENYTSTAGSLQRNFQCSNSLGGLADLRRLFSNQDDSSLPLTLSSHLYFGLPGGILPWTLPYGMTFGMREGCMWVTCPKYESLLAQTWFTHISCHTQFQPDTATTGTMILRSLAPWTVWYCHSWHLEQYDTGTLKSMILPSLAPWTVTLNSMILAPWKVWWVVPESLTSGFRMTCEWFQNHPLVVPESLPSGSKRTREWFQKDSRVVPEWLASGSRMTREWFQDDSRVVPEWLASGSWITLEWFKNHSQVIPEPHGSGSRITHEWFQNHPWISLEWFENHSNFVPAFVLSRETYFLDK